jgi:PAS domain-containing protein
MKMTLMEFRRLVRMEVTKFASQLSTALKAVTVHLRRAQNLLTRMGRGVGDKPRRAPEALRARGNELRKLLASPLNAVVVTDDSYRFLVSNPKALDLFGASPTNVTKFTIDIFLSHGQVLNFTRNASPFTTFIRRRERHGKCKITRLDGSLRVAEYVFVANFAPRRHVFRFCDVPRKTARYNSIVVSSTCSNPARDASRCALFATRPRWW